MRQTLARLALWLGYHCLDFAWICLHHPDITPPATTPPLVVGPPLPDWMLRDDVVTALLMAQEHRLRRGQERVH